jgi:hypothetical protein
MRSASATIFFTMMFWGAIGETEEASATPSLEVEARFDGQGEVNEDHPIVLLLFDGPSFQNVVAARTVFHNGAIAKFETLPNDFVYLLAVYDEFGSVTGLTIPTDTPLGIYLDEGTGEPAAIQPNTGTKIEMVFDAQQRYPANPAKPDEPLVALESAANGIVEIRIYTTKPGKREDFIKFFEDRTLVPQSEVGIRIPGQFRSLEDEDKFVWTRSFRSQVERVRQTREFYFGDFWLQELGPQAAELIESTEVILLEPTLRSLLQTE